jgi:hypothetical protein
VTGPKGSTEPVFPWLPGEAHRLPDPAWTYRDDPDPPKHVMLALQMLALDCAPQSVAPPEWLAAIAEDSLNSPMRAFAREHFGLLDIWNEESQSYDWLDRTALNPDGTAVAVSREDALQRCWTGHTQLVLHDLAQRGETVAQAIERIPREWRRWTEARAREFVATWRDAAAWPPAIALSWIMFEGDCSRIAAYLKNGREISSTGIFLDCLGSFLEEDDAAVADRYASRNLMRALRLRPDHPKRVVALGRRHGQGLLTEISPHDFAELEWAMDPPEQLGAVLQHRGGEFYSNVVIDAATLCRAFPGHDATSENLASLNSDHADADWAKLAELQLKQEKFWSYPVTLAALAFTSTEALWAAHIHTPMSSEPLEVLRTISETLVGEGLGVSRRSHEDPAQVLMHALKAGEIVAWGKLKGAGARERIPLEQWGRDGGLHTELTLLVKKEGLVCADRASAPTYWYTNVCFEAATVQTYLGTLDAHSPSTERDLMLQIAKQVVKPGMRAQQRNEAIRSEYRASKLVPPSNTKIKRLLQGTEFVPSRNRRT